MRGRFILTTFACGLLWSTSIALPQKPRKQPPRKKPSPSRPIDFSDVAIPSDEVLYDDLDRLLESRWRLATKSVPDAKKQAANAYYDKESIIRPAPGRVQTWIKYVDTENGEETRAYNMVLNEYDCSSRRIRAFAFTQYGKDGNVVRSSSGKEPSDWDYITPDTLSEVLFDILCRGAKDLGQRNQDSASWRFRTARKDEKAGRYLQALEWYHKALEYDPGNVKINEAIDRVEKKVNPPR